MRVLVDGKTAPDVIGYSALPFMNAICLYSNAMGEDGKPVAKIGDDHLTNRIWYKRDRVEIIE